MSAIIYIIVKQREKGWDLILDEGNATSVSHPDNAEQQVRDYLDTIEPSVDHSSIAVNIKVSPEHEPWIAINVQIRGVKFLMSQIRSGTPELSPERLAEVLPLSGSPTRAGQFRFDYEEDNIPAQVHKRVSA